MVGITAMVLLWLVLISQLTYLNSQRSPLPAFLEPVSEKARDEYYALFNLQLKLSKNNFNNICKQWARKQGPQVEALFEEYLRQQEAFQKKRYDVLMHRLQKARGSEAAKKLLSDVLEMQQNMDIPMGEREQQVNKLLAGAPQNVQNESNRLWNQLRPHQID